MSLLPVRKYGATMQVSRETLVLMGYAEPTPEERAIMDANRAAYNLRKQAATEALPWFISTLNEVTNPVARAVLDLHKRDDGQCVGCDWSGYEGEPPGWPCRTVEAVAGVLDIVVPADLAMVGWGA